MVERDVSGGRGKLRLAVLADGMEGDDTLSPTKVRL